MQREREIFFDAQFSSCDVGVGDVCDCRIDNINDVVLSCRDHSTYMIYVIYSHYHLMGFSIIILCEAPPPALRERVRCDRSSANHFLILHTHTCTMSMICFFFFMRCCRETRKEVEQTGHPERVYRTSTTGSQITEHTIYKVHPHLDCHSLHPYRILLTSTSLCGLYSDSFLS